MHHLVLKYNATSQSQVCTALSILQFTQRCLHLKAQSTITALNNAHYSTEQLVSLHNIIGFKIEFLNVTPVACCYDYTCSLCSIVSFIVTGLQLASYTHPLYMYNFKKCTAY